MTKIILMFSLSLTGNFFKDFFKFLFIYFYFWLCWAFLATHVLSLVAASRDYSSLQCMGSVVVAHGLSSCGLWVLESRFSSCGAQAQLLHDMWNLPGPGIEPMSPALTGRFLFTVPPGKFSLTKLT